MTQILITGGAGYIGSMLYLRLKQLNHNPIIYDNLTYNQTSLERINAILKNRIPIKDALTINPKDYEKIDYVHGDIRDKEKLEGLFKKYNFDFVFHFADIVGYFPCEDQKDLSHEISTKGTKIIAELCKKHDSKLIYNSTSSIYGLSPTENLIDEDFEIKEIKDQYSKNKFESEQIIKELNPDHVILRPATVSGLSLRMRPDLLPNHFTYRAWLKRNLAVSDPGHYRAFIEINDMIDAYVLVLNNFKKGTYNLGSLNLTKLAVVNEIEKQFNNLKLSIVQNIGDKRNLKIDSSRFCKTFDFKPKRDFEDIIVPMINFLEKEGDFFNKKEYLNMTREQWKKLME
ncbi:MAG: NAD(P)-dependent oxidoreductase [Candidatus Nanoarchaeia archaeon]|nr:NAD(P)-dependent oxidoreductase [Candidatus Nanoarchaeia archaeon]